MAFGKFPLFKKKTPEVPSHTPMKQPNWGGFGASGMDNSSAQRSASYQGLEANRTTNSAIENLSEVDERGAFRVETPASVLAEHMAMNEKAAAEKMSQSDASNAFYVETPASVLAEHMAMNAEAKRAPEVSRFGKLKAFASAQKEKLAGLFAERPAQDTRLLESAANWFKPRAQAFVASGLILAMGAAGAEVSGKYSQANEAQASDVNDGHVIKFDLPSKSQASAQTPSEDISAIGS